MLESLLLHDGIAEGLAFAALGLVDAGDIGDAVSVCVVIPAIAGSALEVAGRNVEVDDVLRGVVTVNLGGEVLDTGLTDAAGIDFNLGVHTFVHEGHIIINHVDHLLLCGVV